MRRCVGVFALICVKKISVKKNTVKDHVITQTHWRSKQEYVRLGWIGGQTAAG
jgi:hypothetical protein